ncbi:MAG: S41 family peptidase [Patescibacteria group bacterium]
MKYSFLGKISIAVIMALSLLVAFSAGVYAGYENQPISKAIANWTDLNAGRVVEVDMAPFWEVWLALDDNLAVLNGDKDQTEKERLQERLWGAIQGMVRSTGDPYSVFLPPSDKKHFEEDISGNFGGVGMEVGIRDGILTVISPLSDTPAQEAGLQAGDKIIEIDGESTEDMSVDSGVKLIRGKKGTVVQLTIAREGESDLLNFDIERDIISIPIIETEELEGGIFLIKFYNFSASSPEIFRQALQEFVLSNADKLIIDLRGNPGGYMEAAIDTASWFLPAGEVVVQETRGEESSIRKYRSRGYNTFSADLPLVILIDRGSASASEILAGALAEHGIATLIGQPTFAKGSVQELLPISGGSALKVTIAHWKTPEGKILSKEGLTPDIEVEITQEDIEAEKDPVLDKAIDYLQNEF